MYRIEFINHAPSGPLTWPEVLRIVKDNYHLGQGTPGHRYIDRVVRVPDAVLMGF